MDGKAYITLNDGRDSKNKRYMIGTVCRISEKNRRAYFLADSDINAKGIPIDVDASDISMSLVSLWDTLAIEGNQEPYRIPLLGTGKARAKDASRNEVVREIILSFLAATKEHKITESLTICIHPKDFDKIDWDALCEFLKYESQYTNLKPMFSKPSGVEEKTPSVVKLRDKEIEDDTSEYDPDNTVVPHLQDLVLTEKEKLMITILQGNEMKKTEVAAAMGLTMNATTRILSKLQSAGLVQSKGGARNLVYSASVNKTDS
ncbi:macro domain-containing protein [Chordicoccus furentiruminis]|uniref:macro domain-containing protein n=1 Tax=Chordicoccus furentiruminis TaxID=2709410 RepID=UPI0023A90E41|nr:macro domain-containing protein [Chordicoccus furentiruminis]